EDLRCRPRECEHIELERHQDVRSHRSDLVADALVQTVHHGRDADHGCHADHDSQHGEAAPQFVLADGVHRHAEYLAVIASSRHSYNSDLSATIGSRSAARRAGYTPKNIPTLAETISPDSTAHNSIFEGMPMASVTVFATAIPPNIPITPPTND